MGTAVTDPAGWPCPFFFLARASQPSYGRGVSDLPPYRPEPARQPVFNAPTCVVALCGLLAAIHAIRVLLLSDAVDFEVLLQFAFIPRRYGLPEAEFFAATGLGPRLWTPVTYALLHGNWMHLGFNLVWFVAFGTPVARRFGATRFILFCAVTAVVGAGAHYLSYPEGGVPLVGASGAISGVMAAAVRFIFAPGGALSPRWSGRPSEHNTAHTLGEGLRDRRVLVFMALWVGFNLLLGLGVSLPGIGDAEVAWQAHIGGFLAGLLLFDLFDPVRMRRAR